MNHISKIKVLMANEVIGLLTNDIRGNIYFQYDEKWIKNGFDIAPHTMKFSSDPQLAGDRLFNGLHGWLVSQLKE